MMTSKLSPKHLLILREDAIGDMVLILPLIDAIRQRHPHTKITVLASNYSHNDAIIRHHPHIHDVMISPHIQSMRDIWTFAQILRKQKVDCALHLSTRSGTAWACFWGVRHNLGDKAILGLWPVFARWGRFHPPHDMMCHQVQRNFWLSRALGLTEADAAQAPPTLHPHPEDSDAVHALFTRLGIRLAQPRLCLHLGAAGGNKPVLPEKYADYVTQLHQKHPDIQILITGASDEEKQFRDRFLQHVQAPVFDLVGQTRVREMLTVLSLCQLFVGIDTGPAHMAAGLGIPQMLLSTSKRVLPFKWGPWRNRHIVIRNNTRCPIPCHARACAEWTCSDDLSVPEMVAATTELLQGKGYADYDDQQQHWFCIGMPILLLITPSEREAGHQLYTQLKAWGVQVHMTLDTDPELYQKCVAWDIRIIQNLGKKRRTKLFWMSQLLNRELSHPPLLCHGYPEAETLDGLIGYYRQRFRKRIL